MFSKLKDEKEIQNSIINGFSQIFNETCENNAKF